MASLALAHGPASLRRSLADQRISAAEAYEWRLVEEVAEPGKAFDAAMALAAKVAAQPPLSVAMTKLTVNRLAHTLDDLASHMDLDQFALASLTDDHKEGVEAFLERRIRFDQIHHVNLATLTAVDASNPQSLDELLELDARSREAARRAIARLAP